MTEKLEALFDLPADEKPTETEVVDSMKETVEKLKKQTMALTLSSKIDSSFSNVNELEKHEREMDLIAEDAIETYGNLIDMAMNVEAQYTARLMEVAAQMMNAAIVAKTNKIDKKLKMIELQLKKQKLDQDANSGEDPGINLNGEGVIIADRNSLIEQLKKMK